MRVLGVSGSLRQSSHNTQLLRAAEELASEGVALELYDGLAAVPPYVHEDDADAPPAAVRDLRERIAAADAVLFATPEYNGSIPGALKNAIDWASRPFPDSALRAKPVAVVGASTSGYGAMWAQADLRRVLGIAGARVLESGVAVPLAHEGFDDAGRLVDPQLGEQLEAVLRELVAEALPIAAAA